MTHSEHRRSEDESVHASVLVMTAAKRWSVSAVALCNTAPDS